MSDSPFTRPPDVYLCCSYLAEHFRPCEQHGQECPDKAVLYNGKFREFSLNAPNASYKCGNCPWCGKKFPESLRDVWFDRIEPLKIDVWMRADLLPEQYKSEKWWMGDEEIGFIVRLFHVR